MKKILIIAVAVIALAAVAWFLLTRKSVGPNQQSVAGTPGETAAEPSAGLGGQLFDQVQQNPGAKIPDMNPVQGNLNPYQNGYVNPF